MKQLIVLFSLLLTVQLGTANTPVQDGEGMIEAKAKELTKKYKAELALDATQATKFQSILASYMQKKAKAKKLDVSEGDRAVMIKQLAAQEGEDIAELLSKGQYKKYLKAKGRLQP